MLTLLLALISVDTLNLTLDQSLRLAWEHSPTVADARLDSVDGNAKVWQGWSNMLPSLNGSAGLGWSNSRSRVDTTRRETSRNWSLGVSASQILFNAGVLGAVGQGYIGRDLLNLQSKSKVTQLVWNVKTGYYGLQTTYGLLDVARSAVKNAADNLELTRVKQRLGKSTGLEVLRAQTNASQAQLNLMSAEQNLQTASEAFKAALGIASPALVKPEPIDTNPPAAQFGSFDDYWGAVGQANPAMQIAEKSVKAAELGRKVAWGQLLPTLSFSASERYSNDVLPSRTSKWSNNDATSWGFDLGLPILNVKDIVLGIHDADIAVERARISRRSSEIQLQQTAVSAWLNHDQSRRQVEFAAENLHLNRELYRQAQEQYRLGQLTQLDLFTVETGLSQARVSYLSALADVRVRQAQIDYLLGK